MNFDGKDDLIKKVQHFLNLKEDGKDGPITWNAIIKSLEDALKNQQSNEINPSISKKAFDLIIKYEVGGGKNYYDKYLQFPTWPKGASGVTIGIGYDLGYNSYDQFSKDWKGKISDQDFNKLALCLGKKGDSASKEISAVKNISISWDIALNVFNNSTLPRFINETLKAFPNSDKLHPDAFGALVSLVFNRGSSTTGDSRREMYNIQQAIKGQIQTKNIYSYIANEIKSMKRLWLGKGLDGLLTRRDEEAKLIEYIII